MKNVRDAGFSGKGAGMRDKDPPSRPCYISAAKENIPLV